MKKLLVLLLLIFTVTLSAQDKYHKQIKFTFDTCIDEDGESDCYGVILLSYKNNIDYIKMYASGYEFLYKIISTEIRYTDSGSKFIHIKTKNIENDKIFYFFVFEDVSKGIGYMDSKNNLILYTNSDL